MSESQALLQHDDSPTAILSRKLRSLMQYNALGQGYMPSSSQIQDHLAAVAQSPLLNSRQRGLSRQTKTVLEDTRSFFRALSQLVKDKNEGDLVQEIIWNLRGAQADTDFDGDMFAARLSAAAAKADAKTAHMKAKAVADVLYSNPQFRALIHDGSILARDVLSDVVEATATAIAPEESDLIELEQEATDVDGRAIKDDVEDTKKSIDRGIESAKSQVKQTYDEATTAAIQTLKDLQERGEAFGEEARQTAGKVVKEGRAKAEELAGDVSKSADAALAKLEEVTGIKQSDIRERLNKGISIDEIVQTAKSVAGDASDKIRDVANKADQKGGRMVNQASSATADFADRNDVKGKVNSVVEQSSATISKIKSDTKDGISQAKDKGDELAKQAKPKMDAAAQQAGDSADQAMQRASEAKKEVESTAGNLVKSAGDAADSAKNQMKDTRDKAQQQAQTAVSETDSKSSSNHLQEIGIIHPNIDTVGESTGTDLKYAKKTAADNETDDGAQKLLQNITSQLEQKVKGVSGITKEQIEDAARDLIRKTNRAGSDIKRTAKEKGQEADQKAGELTQQASESAENAKVQASEAADSAADKASEAATNVQDKTSGALETGKQKTVELKSQGQAQGSKILDQAKDATKSVADSTDTVSKDVQAKVADLSQQVNEIDTQDLQEAVNNLLRTAKAKLEQSTGVTADEARQSLDWAIRRGEELAEEAMKQGRKGASVVQENAGEAMSVIKEKSAEIGEATQRSMVTVGAQAKHALQNAPQGAAGQIHDTLDASQEFVDSAVQAVKESTSEIREYLGQKFPPKRRQALQKHFQGLAVALRDNSDYSNGLDGLISIGKKYVDYTLSFTEELPTDAGDVVSTNAELDNAVRLTLQLIERFSNGVGFKGVQQSYVKLKKDMQKEKGSGDFLHDCMIYFKKIVQDMKYASSKDAEKHGRQLLDRVDAFSEDTGFKQDVNTLIRELVRLAEGFGNDNVLLNVVKKGQTLFKHLVMNEYGNFVFKKRVMKDFFNIIMPSALRLVQYVPISRIEFQNAEVDVLIENLVFESSASHDQSFLPYRLKIDNHNQVEFLNAYKFESDYSNQVTIRIEGLTLAVRDAGFYIRKKTGFWRFMDSGLVDLIMDGPGVDVAIDLAMSTEDEEGDVTKDALFIVKDVRVNIRKLDFSTSGTRYGWLIGLVKPFIRPFIRRQVGLAIGSAVKDQLTFYEYQLRMLQHRIKTAYIANNGQASYESFFRAIFTANAGNNAGRKGQFEVVVGKQGPLAGIFTKASLQRELEDADAIAHEHGRPHSWRNDIFDL